ncbi:MAG: hypothetical protein RLZZ630_1472, partial [Bacteroidota bacterium]
RSLFSEFPGVGRLRVQRFLLLIIAFDQVLDFPKQHLHEDGLRTGPSAPQASEQRGEQDDEHHEGEHRQYEEVKILWPECDPENDELPFEDIE